MYMYMYIITGMSLPWMLHKIVVKKSKYINYFILSELYQNTSHNLKRDLIARCEVLGDFITSVER